MATSAHDITRLLQAWGLIVLMLAACRGTDNPTDSPRAVAIFPDSLSLFTGDSATLTASVVDRAGATIPWPNIAWTCDNPTVALVSSGGVVRAIAPGTATVRAAAGAVASTLPLLVAAPTCVLTGQVGYVAPSAYTPPTGATCDVASPDDVPRCIAALESGAIDLVRITTLVQCGATSLCNINLGNIARPVTIFGSPGGAGFIRTGGYETTAIYIHNSAHVTLANFLLDDGPSDTSCDRRARTGINPCESTVTLRTSSDLTLDRMILRNAQEHAISIAQLRSVRLQNSEIDSAAVFGVWTGNDDPTKSIGVVIENNLIRDVRTNGIFLSYTDSTILRHNTLQHDHHVAIFNSCGGLCPGGQLDIIGNSRLRIEANQIIDGVIDANNATGQASGMEVNGYEHDVTITGNLIANNLGAGIYANPGTTNMTNFVIQGNDIYNNGINMSNLMLPGIEVRYNCYQHP